MVTKSQLPDAFQDFDYAIRVFDGLRNLAGLNVLDTDHDDLGVDCKRTATRPCAPCSSRPDS